MSHENRAREAEGWRAGRPVEDPAKLKSWGLVTARPSEFLIHVRGGRLRQSSSGQGATCFKWPWDSVAVVPTSLQRLRFEAEQVTAERVGVKVVGLAVYRIAEPLMAYRVLNFSFPERAQEKLEETLVAMFEGASRRLIANLTVDDCLQKRKESIAAELLREIAPVVGGEGRTEDTTNVGWGVVIDTIEIQEVRVLSDKVFAAMQAPFRAALERRAREAQVQAQREVNARETECTRAAEELRLRTEAQLSEQRAQIEAVEAETRKAQSLRTAEFERQVQEARLAAESALRLRRAETETAELEAKARDLARRGELFAAEARAELEACSLRAELATRRAELEQLEWSAAHARRLAHSETARREGIAAAEVSLAQARADQEKAEAQARVILAQNLPQLAAAVGQRFGEVKITQIGGDGSPFGAVAQAVASVLELVNPAGARPGS